MDNLFILVLYPVPVGMSILVIICVIWTVGFLASTPVSNFICTALSKVKIVYSWHFHSYYSNIVSNLYFESYPLVFAYYSHHSPPHPTRIQSFFEILQFQLSEPSRLEWKHVFSNTDRSLNNNINDAKVTLLDSWQRALRHHLDNPRRCSRSLKSKRRENRWWCNKKSHMNKKMNNRIEKRVETEKQRSVQTCSSYSLLFFRSCNTIGVV